jgi:acyl-CoA thioester hydrolase
MSDFNQELENFPVIIDIPVAWGEMDSFSHVNNIIYFRYFESSRMEYFKKIEFIDFMNKNQVGPILASTDCKFIFPATYPDTLKVGSRVEQVDDNSFIMKYKVFSTKANRLSALGSGKIVCFDYKNNKKVSVPEIILKNIKNIEKKS